MTHIKSTSTYEGEIKSAVDGVGHTYLRFEGSRADKPEGCQGYYSGDIDMIIQEAIGGIPSGAEGKQVRVTIQVLD